MEIKTRTISIELTEEEFTEIFHYLETDRDEKEFYYNEHQKPNFKEVDKLRIALKKAVVANQKNTPKLYVTP